MVNRNIMIVFIMVSLLAVLYFNYYIAIPSLWMLFMIPALCMIILFSTWTVTILVGLAFTIMTGVTEFAAHKGEIPFEYLVQLIVTGIVAWILLAVVSFFRIRTVRLIGQLKNLALIDPLTQVHNRRYFNLYMEEALPLYDRKKNPMTIMILDIDYFKRINDTYGHNTGDKVLKKLARVAKGIIRESDELVRMGGEEFMIILPNSSLKQGIQLAERLRKVIERIRFKDDRGKKIPVTISVGVAEYNGEKDLEQFIESADQALYQAKENGRNRVIFA